jgi:hypothetical protein
MRRSAPPPIVQTRITQKEEEPMSRGRDWTSMLDAILAWGRPSVSPVRPAPALPDAIAVRPARADPDLLLMRMEALQLDPGRTKAAAPEAFRLLAHVCRHCQCKLRCERDLLHEAAGRIVAWESYCPNASRLKAIGRREAI